MKLHVSLFISSILPFIGFSQAADSLHLLESVEQLHFMQGNWKGEGWILGKDRKKMRFLQSEIIANKVDSKALMIDGLGYGLDSLGVVTDRIVHEAFGVISYNEEKESVTMITFSKKSGRMESDLALLGERKLQWSFEEPKNGTTIRFTEDFSEEGTWKELGEILLGNNEWYKFFEMTLRTE